MAATFKESVVTQKPAPCLVTVNIPSPRGTAPVVGVAHPTSNAAAISACVGINWMIFISDAHVVRVFG